MNTSYLATAFHWDLCNMFLWVFPAAQRIAPWPNWYRSSVVWSQVFQLCFWCHFSFSRLRDRLSFLCTKQSLILLQEPTVHFQHLSCVCVHMIPALLLNWTALVRLALSSHGFCLQGSHDVWKSVFTHGLEKREISQHPHATWMNSHCLITAIIWLR